MKTLHKKMKFEIKDFLSKWDQIHSFLRIWSYLLKKPLMENFIFCAVHLALHFPWNKLNGALERTLSRYNLVVEMNWFLYNTVHRHNRVKSISYQHSLLLHDYTLLNNLNANPTKWSNTLKHFAGCCRRFVWVCLTILLDWRLKS